MDQEFSFFSLIASFQDVQSMENPGLHYLIASLFKAMALN